MLVSRCGCGRRDVAWVVGTDSECVALQLCCICGRVARATGALLQGADVDPKEEEHILYANAAVTYSSILIKVYVMFEHALQRGSKWLLKTDDDAYVNIPQTVQA